MPRRFSFDRKSSVGSVLLVMAQRPRRSSIRLSIVHCSFVRGISVTFTSTKEVDSHEVDSHDMIRF